MSLRALDYRTCDLHSTTLHHQGCCVQCHPLPEPRVRRPTTSRRNPKRPQLGRPASKTLTAREVEVALLIATGRTQLDIAGQLGITRAAVESCVRRAMDRMGMLQPYELVRYVRERSSAQP